MPTKPLTELKAAIGRSHQTVTDLEVESGKVEEFARAIKTNQDIYDHEPGDSGGTPAPLTFTRVSVFPRYRATDSDGILGFDLGLELPRVVHGSQGYEFERPVQTGDVLTGETTVTEVYERENDAGQSMVFVTFETKYRDAADELVVTERMTIIELGDSTENESNGGDESDDNA